MGEGLLKPTYRSRLQTAPVLLRSKGAVVSDWGKGIARCQVCIEKMSESKPSRTHRYCLKVLPKLGLTIGPGIQLRRNLLTVSAAVGV